MQLALALAQVPDDLLDEERVAVGLAVQGADERRLGGGDAERRDELGDLRLGQALELEALEHALAAHVGDQLEQRVAGLELGVAVGAEQEDAARLRRADEVPQQLQRRAVGPVEVVEHEHERRLRARLAEQRGDRVEEAGPAGVGVARRRRRAAGPSSPNRIASSAARTPSRSRSGSSDAPDDHPRTISTTGWYGASASSSKRP